MIPHHPLHYFQGEAEGTGYLHLGSAILSEKCFRAKLANSSQLHRTYPLTSSLWHGTCLCRKAT